MPKTSDLQSYGSMGARHQLMTEVMIKKVKRILPPLPYSTFQEVKTISIVA
jgi:hypothetical protein